MEQENAPSFAVSIEPEKRLMHIVVRGFWPANVLPNYSAALRRNVEALAPHGGCKRILVDMSDYPIQSQDVAEAHSRIIRHGRTEMRAVIAIVMTSVLSRLQAKRIANVAGNELFDDEVTARAWLEAQPLN